MDRIKTFAFRGALALVLLTGVCQSQASLFGPWFRYRSDELGFQIPVASGWRVTPVPQGVVFAMQYQPQPYVRMAIGRLRLGGNSLEPMILDDLQQMPSTQIHRTECLVDGKASVKLEGSDANGPFLQYFIKNDPYCYWIGFHADRNDLWPEYSRTFQIIIEGFQFI